MALIKEWALGILASLAICAVIFGTGYFSGKASRAVELATLNGQIQQQKDQAAQRLAELTAQRDKIQAERDRQAADQEKKDADAQAEIARLAGELESRPVRVRVAAPARSCAGGAAGEGAATAKAGAGDAATTYGLLPPENTRRLNAALTEVETLSAAYTSCRARLMGGQ